MRLIPIRHGETEWNLIGREMGHLDSPLTERGIAQARAVARRIAELRPGVLYTSDLGRAVQTAEIIQLATGLTAVREPALRERHMGVLQGLVRAEAQKLYPAVFAEYDANGFFGSLPGGETVRERTERSVRILTAIAEKHPDQTVVAVTHSGFLMGFVEHVLGLGPGNGWRFERQNASYNAFLYERGVWRLETWNDTAHLT